MNIRNVLMGLLLLGFVGTTGYLTYHYLVLPTHECEICGRAVHAVHHATVEMKSGRRVQACCPRCAMHYRLNTPGKVMQVLVADNVTGRAIEAQKATYVEGSDVEPCMSASESVPREPGVEYTLKYDRCLPSLLAFRDESEAREFQRQHGGHVLSFAEAEESVRRR